MNFMTKYTLKTSNEYSLDTQWRTINLEVAKWCLQKFKETQDEFYYQQAKNFGEWSKLIKEKYLI